MSCDCARSSARSANRSRRSGGSATSSRPRAAPSAGVGPDDPRVRAGPRRDLMGAPMRRAPERRGQRLSRQLWASHFTVIVITLVALVGSIVLLASLWLVRQGFALREPALDAQVVSIAIGNLVRRGVPEPTISSFLAEMRNGGVRLPAGPLATERGLHWGGPPAALRPDLQDVDY